MLRNIGEMKHRITFQKRIDGEPDEKGYPRDTWADIAKAWAYREDVSGKEFFDAASINMEETMTFTIHHKKGLDTSMRVVHKGESFDIIHIGGGRNVGDLLIIRTKRTAKEGSGPDQEAYLDGKSQF